MLPESLRRLAFSVVGATALALVTSTSAFAQGSTGKIQGRVVDSQSGQPIAAAQVEVVGTNRGNITNDDGYYFINDVPAGLMDIRAVSIGYQDVVVNDQRILAGQTHTQNFSLAPTAVEIEAIVIEGERNPLVPRDQVSSRAIVTGETVDNLPLDNASSIVALQPGVISSNTGLSIRGSRPNEEATYVDGVLVRSFQTGDADPLELPTNSLAQVDVTTGGFSAQYSDAQSGIVNYTTRTGGSEFSGSAAYFTDVVAPKDWRTGLHRGELSIGGPLFAGLSFFAAGTLEGQRYGTQAPGTEFFVQSGVDTTFVLPVPAPSDATGLTDSVAVAFPTFERWDNGPTQPFDQRDEYSLVTRLGYALGAGSNLTASYYRNRDQSLGRTVNDLYNPQGTTASLDVVDVVNLGGYFVIFQSADQALALDLNASYQSFKGTDGIPDPSWLADHSDPALGFNFSTIDFIAEPGSFELTDELYYGARHGILPDSIYALFPGRTDLANRQTFAGGDVALRMNPYGMASQFPVAGYGTRCSSLGTCTLALNDRFETGLVASASVDWQAGRYNRIFVGGDYRDINMEGMQVSLFEGPISPYRNDPTRAGFFLQDRLDLGDVVLEAGLRFDYFNPGGQFSRIPGAVTQVPDSLRGDAYVLDPLDGAGDTRSVLERVTPLEDCGGASTEAARTRDDGTIVCKNNWVDAETKTAWSPRVAVSFPVTSTSTFRLSYGQNVQVPALQAGSGFDAGVGTVEGMAGLFSGSNAQLGSMANTNARFGRDVELPRTTLFEAGYRQLFGESLVVDLAAYAKTVRNGLTYRTLPFTDPVTGGNVGINVLTNADFAQTRGVDVRVDKRFGELVDVTGAYSYIDARGTGSDPLNYTSLFKRGTSLLAQRLGIAVPAPEAILPLDVSRTHNFSGTLSLLFPGDWGDGAQGLLNDVGVFATFSAASGLPFTRIVNNGDGQIGPPTRVGLTGEIAEAINASRTPWTRELDLRVHKGLAFGDTRLRVFADWRNPLNLENLENVFLETGTAYNQEHRDAVILGHLNDVRLDGDAAVDDFYVQCFGFAETNCEVPDDQPSVNAYSLQQAEARFGDGDGLYTVEEQENAINSYYDIFQGEQIYRRSDQSLRLGVEVAF